MNGKKVSIILLCILIFTISLIHFYFFKIDERPAIDHDEWHSNDVIVMYNELEKEGLNFKFFLIPFQSRWLVNSQSQISVVFPPFTTMLLGLVFYFFGTSLFIYKMVNIVYFILLILAVYLIGKEIVGYKAGIISAFIIATMPMMINFSRKNFLFFPEASFVMLALYLFIKTRNFTNRKYSIFFGIVSGLMMLVHYMGIVYLGIFIILYLLHGEFDRAKIINGILSLSISILIWGKWYKDWFFGYFLERISASPFFFTVDNYIRSVQGFIIAMQKEFMFPIYFYLFIASLPLICYYTFKNTQWKKKLFGLGSFVVIPLFIAINVNASSNGCYDLFDWQVFMPAIVVLMVSCLFIFYSKFNAIKLVRFGALIIVVILIINGIFILIWPLAYDTLNALEEDKELGQIGLISNRIGKRLIGERLEENIFNCIFPHRKPFDVMQEIMDYFMTERIARNGQDIKFSTNFVFHTAILIGFNGFFEGLSLEKVWNYNRFDLYDYFLFFMVGYDKLYYNDDKIMLVLTTDDGDKKTVILDGFKVERVINISSNDKTYDVADGTLYILKKVP